MSEVVERCWSWCEPESFCSIDHDGTVLPCTQEVSAGAGSNKSGENIV